MTDKEYMTFTEQKLKELREKFYPSLMKMVSDVSGSVVELDTKQLEKFLSQALEEQGKKFSEKNFEYMEECEPDCDAVRHARHQGSWDHYWKLDRYLSEYTQNTEGGGA